MQIINPATEEVITDLRADDVSAIQTKFDQLKNGQRAWRQLSVKERLVTIEQFGKLVVEHLEELATTLTQETGKPITQSRNEIKGALGRISHLRANAEKWLSPEIMVAEGETREFISYEPLGVVCNISAWNFPYNVGFNVFLYALVAGNAVCYKPSEYASLTGLKFQKLLHLAGVPEDVFQTVIGDGSVGQVLLEMTFDGYYFTGSHQTGVKIAQAVAHKLVPIQLELGGKDPLYVMDDVGDVKQAAINAAEGAFYNNGQSCCAVERIYVQTPIYDQFIEAFIEEVKGYKIGDPMEEDTFIGPLTRSGQRRIILDQLADSEDKGGTILLSGGVINDKGYYIQPSVVTDTNHSMQLMIDESFGPIIGIQKVSDDKEALALMADTSYGLTAAIFSQDEKRAKRLLDQLNVGTVYWNCCDRVSPNLPWSGRNKSGLGSTLSYTGIRAFVQPKAFHVRGC